MKKFLVGLLVSLLVLTQFMLPIVPAALAAGPTDIAGNWAEADITRLVNLGYIAGYPDGTFKPNNSVTRAEFLKIITGVLNYPEPAPAGASPYSDVAMTDWFFKYVISAGQNNLVGGYPDGTFLPNNPITRQEVAKILVKAKNINEATYVTADELANMAITVPDWATISDWAKPFVAAAIKAGLMKGDPTGNFRPLGNLTRAETATVGARLLPVVGGIKVGLVTDVGGRGDKSFNDSALRGLEQWAGGQDLTTIPEDLKNMGIVSLGVTPVILESKASEDYIPNLTKLAKDEKCDLVIAVGFMLADAIKEITPQFPDTKFMLIDSTVDPMPPNLVCYTFKEQEGSFLVGAMAAQMTVKKTLGFVGGMELPIIKKFEAGYKAGIQTINKDLKVLVNYTGNFSSADDGKKAAVSQFGQNADIVFAAAGACGIGVIQEAKDRGAGFFAIGVDSDQDYMAPGRVLTSMIKHVDLAVYDACKSVATNAFKAGLIELGVKEGGVGYSPLTYTKDIIPAAVLAKVDALKALIADGTIKVPATLEELATFVPPALPAGLKVGLVTDVGGRGDKSFNDSALRGLEQWAGGQDLTTIPEDLKNMGIVSLGVTPVILESKASEDYIPNLTKLAKDEKCDLVIAVGFMLADAIKEITPQFPDTKFMLIDSTVDPMPPNLVCYTFKEQEGSFLVGAMAAQMTTKNILGFVGGMELPIIKKFEAGYKAGIKTVNAETQVLVNYTGNFSSADDGKKAAVSQFGQNADIIFAAAGACGIGVIQEAKDRGAGFFAIGVDSDQDYMAPGRVLTSMIKHVDLAVYDACKSVATNAFKAGLIELGVKEGGVGYSPLTYTKDIIPAGVLATVNALKAMISDGTIKVPATLEELATFVPPAIP